MGKALKRISLALSLLALVVMQPVRAQESSARYPRMAPLDQYLMHDRNAEIALARSAAPEAISRDATVLVLGRHGYETAVKGTNGFFCFVERGWTSAIDFPELWNPKLRGPDCLNLAAAHSLLPIVYKKTAMVLAGYSEPAIVSSLKVAFRERRLPPLETGAMSYMMSKAAYLTDDGSHNLSHLMFYTTLPDGSVWGADLPRSPIASSSYWFPAETGKTVADGLPAILVFVVGVKRWSDGTTQISGSGVRSAPRPPG